MCVAFYELINKVLIYLAYSFILIVLIFSYFLQLLTFRSFFKMRILKLAKRWPTLNKLLVVIGQTVSRLWPLTFVFMVVLFIFAVIGMQLFSKKYVSLNVFVTL